MRCGVELIQSMYRMRCSFHEDGADLCVSPCPEGMGQPCSLESMVPPQTVNEAKQWIDEK